MKINISVTFCNPHLQFIIKVVVIFTVTDMLPVKKTFIKKIACKYANVGQRLWLSWLSGRSQHQRFAVLIQNIRKFLSTNCTLEKTEIKKKRPGMAHL